MKDMENIIIAIIAIVPQLVTLFVTIIVNKKVKKQNDFQSAINDRFDNLEAKINDNRKKELRNILVNEYTALINGKRKSKEQKQDIADMFEEYKSLGGDSYIDDLHDIWKEKETKK